MRAFPPLVESVGQARVFAAECTADLDPNQRSALVLLVSELATNCIKHSCSGFELDIHVDGSKARVSVTDDGPGAPVLRDPAPSDTSGRGLRVVQELSDDWGVEACRGGHGKTVWFSMSLP